jgi:hypothetical protein
MERLRLRKGDLVVIPNRSFYVSESEHNSEVLRDAVTSFAHFHEHIQVHMSFLVRLRSVLLACNVAVAALIPEACT